MCEQYKNFLYADRVKINLNWLIFILLYRSNLLCHFHSDNYFERFNMIKLDTKNDFFHLFIW